MRIVVASGKGGTGKTLIATNLAMVATEMGHPVTLVDCDVEEPNSALFLKPEWNDEQPVSISVPLIDNDKCVGCRLCAEKCQFNALITVKNKTYVFEEMCHACGLCMRICPESAISSRDKRIGTFRRGSRGKAVVLEGELAVGVELVSPLIGHVKNAASGSGTVILDAPPGTSCSVVETVRECDVAILVTEPTRFGLNDLKLAVEMMNSLRVPFGIVENRSMEGNSMIRDYCDQHNLPLWMTLPLDRDIATCYSHGKLLLNEIPAYRYRFVSLLDAAVTEVGA